MRETFSSVPTARRLPPLPFPLTLLGCPLSDVEARERPRTPNTRRAHERAAIPARARISCLYQKHQPVGGTVRRRGHRRRRWTA